MTLEARIIKKLPGFTIDVSFRCSPGDMQVIVGPSGAGKTTIMRVLAGLEHADHGLIRFNDTVWEDTGARIFVAPQKRGIGYVFQEYSLFPHLTVAQNVAFASGDPKNVQHFIGFFEIQHLAERFPRQLSGGERQRVALAQALAREPKMLLLDEPFSALDFNSREKLRTSLDELKSAMQIPIIHITHEISAGLRMADTVLPLERGRVSQDWLPAAVRERLPVCREQACGAQLPVTVRKKTANRPDALWRRLFGYFRTCSTW